MPAKSRSDRARIVAVFLGLALVAVLTVVPRVLSVNDGSRMATIESLVDLNTLSIDNSTFSHVDDKVLIDGHYYSDKLATPQLIGALVYWPLSAGGVKLHSSWSLAYYLITLLTVKLFWWFGLVAFFKSLAYTGLSSGRRLWMTLALGLGTLVFSWSSTFNNHSLAASWVALAFYFLLRAKDERSIPASLFVSGIFFGLAGSSDVPTMAFPVAFSVYVLLDRRLRSSAWFFLLALVIASIPAMTVNFLISGSFVPVQIVPENFAWPGSPWTAETLSGVRINSGLFLGSYTYEMLIGKRGFLVYNPISLMAIPLMVREFLQSRLFAREALVVFSTSLVIVSYYCLATNNLGGWSYSIRWFVPLLPLWVFFAYPLLAGDGIWRWMVFGAIFAVSLPIAVIGSWNPFSSLNATIEFAAREAPSLLSHLLSVLRS